MSPREIFHVGAFSMSNYGDQIYPSVIEQLLRRHGHAVPRAHFALIPGVLPDGRAVRPLRDLRADPARSAVLVGGGDLIRVDRRVIGMDHLCIESEARSGVWPRLRGQLFAMNHMGSGPGPWLPSQGWGAPAALLSVGVHPLPATKYIASALASLTGAWVRTRRGARVLAEHGMDEGAIALGPDAVFALPDLVDRDELRRRGQDVLRTATGGGAPVAVFHAAGFAGWSVDRVVGVLGELKGLPVAVLPLGKYAGEDRMLEEAAGRAGASYLGVLPADDTTAVLSAAGCVISTSMHAAIVASSLGRPVIVPGVPKILSAFEACPEPPKLELVTASDIGVTARRVIEAADISPSHANIDAVYKSFQHATRYVL